MKIMQASSGVPSVAGMIDGVTECIEGARVVLRKGEGMIGEAKTDTYGDFKFQGLDENSGSYQIEVIDARFAAKTIKFELKESVYLGAITVERTGMLFTQE